VESERDRERDEGDTPAGKTVNGGGEGGWESVGLTDEQLRRQAEGLAGWLDAELGGFRLPVGS
jgi:hypothetical protein